MGWSNGERAAISGACKIRRVATVGAMPAVRVPTGAGRVTHHVPRFARQARPDRDGEKEAAVDHDAAPDYERPYPKRRGR